IQDAQVLGSMVVSIGQYLGHEREVHTFIGAMPDPRRRHTKEKRRVRVGSSDEPQSQALDYRAREYERLAPSGMVGKAAGNHARHDDHNCLYERRAENESRYLERADSQLGEQEIWLIRTEERTSRY